MPIHKEVLGYKIVSVVLSPGIWMEYFSVTAFTSLSWIIWFLGIQFLASSCGTKEKEPSEFSDNHSPSTPSGVREDPRMLLGTWRGSQRWVGGGSNLAPTPVEITFFPNHTYSLSSGDSQESLTEGLYFVSAKNELYLNPSSLEPTGNNQDRSQTKYNFTLVGAQLFIHDQQKVLSLEKTTQNSGNTPAQMSDKNGQDQTTNFYTKNWSCFAQNLLWKIDFLSKESFSLKVYGPDPGDFHEFKGDVEVLHSNRTQNIQIYYSLRHGSSNQLEFELDGNGVLEKATWHHGRGSQRSPVQIQCYAT